MEVKQAVLVLVDISGYTQFIRKHGMSVLHAEQIITDLLEAVIDTAEYPLQLNKLAQESIQGVRWKGMAEGVRLFAGGLVQRLLVRRQFENLPQ